MSGERDAVEAIRTLLAGYNVEGDRARFSAVTDLFLEDGILETPEATYSGRQAIADGLEKIKSDIGSSEIRPSFVRHHLTTSHIELTGPLSAKARSYFIVYANQGADHAGVYVDRLAWVEGRWFFQHRRVSIDWVSNRSIFSILRPTSTSGNQE